MTSLTNVTCRHSFFLEVIHVRDFLKAKASVVFSHAALVGHFGLLQDVKTASFRSFQFLYIYTYIYIYVYIYPVQYIKYCDIEVHAYSPNYQ
jgi:hypothetical protein